MSPASKAVYLVLTITIVITLEYLRMKTIPCYTVHISACQEVASGRRNHIIACKGDLIRIIIKARRDDTDRYTVNENYCVYLLQWNTKYDTKVHWAIDREAFHYQPCVIDSTPISGVLLHGPK